MLKRALGFGGSEHYWETRYLDGGHSGEGSYGRLADFKAEFLNAFILEKRVENVLEYGCGDGNQLRLASYPLYTGIDVSPRAIETCRALFLNDPSKEFYCALDYDGRTADAVLSLDVIYHLVENAVFERYMRQLFASALRFVIIYSSNSSELFADSPHVHHREFTEWVIVNQTDWKLVNFIPNRYPVGSSTRDTSFAHFFVFQRNP